MLNYEQIKELKEMGFSNADILQISGAAKTAEPAKPTEPEKPAEPAKPTEPAKPAEPANPAGDNSAILAAIQQLTSVIQANAIMTAQNQKDTGPKIEDVVASIIDP